MARDDSECPNPLLLGWLREWMEDAAKKGSKGTLTYKKAYESMKACPLTFQHPSEAQQLHGLGPKLCERLTANLQKHCDQNGLPMPEPPHKKSKLVCPSKMNPTDCIKTLNELPIRTKMGLLRRNPERSKLMSLNIAPVPMPSLSPY
jgi:hypothetical protein